MSVATMPSWRKHKGPAGPQFEFVVYDDNVREIERLTLPMRGDSAAKAKAGSLAKRSNGPVDLAYAGDADWPDRYITTAAPSEYHAKGYRFERLD
jgi:hypothetical protein